MGAETRPAGFARRLHDEVVQRLCSVAAALASNGPLTSGTRRRCKHEIEAALEDIRALIAEEDPSERLHAPSTVAAAVAEACARYADQPTRVRYEGDGALGPEEARFVRDFVSEAIRNAGKHARPTVISVLASVDDGRAQVEVRNDGVVAAAGNGVGTGLGLRLIAADAARHRARLDVQRVGEDWWRVVLGLPLASGHGRRFDRSDPPEVAE